MISTLRPRGGIVSVLEADIVVLGSGGAGLVAACVAADQGNSVVLLERAPVLGGSTAVSGGLVWIPGNPLMAAHGFSDDRDDALRYMRQLTLGQVDDERLVRLVDAGPELVRYLLDQTPVRLQAIDFPDYHPELPGARPGGRTLDNLVFDPGPYPGVGELARQGSHFPLLTYEEAHRWRWPENYDWELIASRMMSGARTMGGALAAALIAAAQTKGVILLAEHRSRELLVEGDRVVGVTADTPQGSVTVRAGRGVVLATGGFEWNQELTRTFLRGPMLNPITPPGNEGDGLLMGMDVGARLGNMTEAWWLPTFSVPGELYDGQPMSRIAAGSLALPGCIVVNAGGERFMNEALNYYDQGRALHEFDTTTYGYRNIPAWMVFDARFKRTYPAATVMPSDDAPSWFRRGDTLAALAAEIGVDPDGLVKTVSRFNERAALRQDPDFGRGESAYDHYHGDPEHGNLGLLEEAPFYAVEVLPGAIGTKGGLMVDADHRVLHRSGRPVPGLYAAGNVVSSTVGPSYPGAGGTLGPALVGGFLAGHAIAKD
jgi:3-oxosteroid 1-dehydrogenase